MLKFFFFTYLVAWAFWIAVAAISKRALPNPGLDQLYQFLFVPGVFAPALVALALTVRQSGSSGVRELFSRIIDWRVGARWYVFALGYMATVKLTVALLHRSFTGGWPRFGDQAWYVMAGAIAVSMWFQAGEEIGWRAYALPRMAERFGLPRASLLLGVIWACWHLPLFFIPGTTTTGQSFPIYLLQVTALSVAAAWLYWRVQQSLLPVMVMHAAVNNTKDIVPSAVPGATHFFALSTSPVAWMTAALLWVAAVYFLFAMRNAKLRDASQMA